ncbi:putative vanillyl-alcohol oxidase [Cladorrhinum samala]|uniref:Vanillyl-alcohol oxidase n=1 Tax=Cladorrhinum samala TaxID=585594 RepID=A0AAV9HNJ3_9PEZI|nr:putative vanillyl-alcohol oxidase [Cladorrhinum samala]
MSTTLPKTYSDPDSEAAHVATYERKPRHPIRPVLPPGVRESEFNQAIQSFTSIVGKEAVFIDAALSDYIDPYDVNEADPTKRKVPSAAVCPKDVSELKSVLSIANTHRVPLWTFSRGKNLGYGGPAPRVNGSVALDLHRMDKILEVNDEFHYAVVEPGVTWSQLYEYCVANKKRVWPSTPSLGWGSVVGNTVDRGMGFGQNYAHHQCVTGMEILLPDGDLIRTGQWGISNSPNAFLSKFTYGPSVEGLFFQSNLGVVTKMSIWLTPQPQSYMCCNFGMPRFDDLEVMVDVFGEMKRNGTISSCVWFTSLIETLCISGRREDYWKGEGPVPDWRLEELRKETGYGHWYARWGLYGPKRIVEATFEEIKHVLKRRAPTGEITGKLYAANEVDGKGQDEGRLDAKTVPAEEGGMFVGIPTMWSLPLINWPIPRSKTDGKPAHGDYAPVIPSSGKMLLEWMKASKPICEANGVELMADFFMHERHVVLMNMFTWDQTDPVQKAKMNKLYHGLYGLAKERGYGMYRGHVNHMDLIADFNDFNNHAYNRFIEKIKDAIDPNGILSPGKQGIWPNRYRHLREVPEKKAKL